eukprot:GHUV01022362.1.p1 GENE.GHUV01022362.1~~GHUV01022362.1.p1  ORF type:complete len:252 (+),score=68.62 GHUV01022362.1:111-866(+)
MSGLLAKRLAQQVTELRSNPDNKRCFNCESLGTTYYVPQFSIFVCTSCSGIHMQFGHRVKSVTLADYKADEVEHMKEGGNQVAAYRYLARYTPDKDLRKPVDRNPQRVRIWIQTVFIDKRFYSADAPVPRRSQEGSGASTPAALTSPAGSLRRSSSSREGSLAGPLPATLSAPVPAAAVAAASRGVTLPSSASSPPVRDMRDLLGDRATALHVGPKLSNEQASSSAGTSRASSVSGLPPTPAAGAAQPSPR